MKIREATSGDAGTIRSILRECDLPDDITDAAGSMFFLAEEGGSAVGTIGLEPYPPVVLLRSAAVLPSFRGRAIGDTLVREVINRAEATGIREIVLLTTTAEGYFRKFGFEKYRRDALTGGVKDSVQVTGDHCSGAVVMRLRLTGEE